MKFTKDSELCLDQSFEKKYVSRIHAGKDILSTNNDALSDSVKTTIKFWYRNKSLRINSLKKIEICWIC